MATSFKNRSTVLLICIILTLIPYDAFAAAGNGIDHQEKENTRVSSTEKVELPSRSNPTFAEYRGVRIGMAAIDVRQKLGKPKVEDEAQDFFVFGESESAQIFYDKYKKVWAISIDFSGRNSDAPTPRDVLGEDIRARADGSMYGRQQYSDVGYWVSYSRTSGDPPQITITMQKMPG